MDKKFELTNESKEFAGVVLYRIKALKDFGNVKAGDLGGFVEKEENLSQVGDCWIYDRAIVCDNARIWGDARVYNRAKVFDEARICDKARIYGQARVYDDAMVCDYAQVYEDARVYDYAVVTDLARICGNAKIHEEAEVYSYAMIDGYATICGNAKVGDNAKVHDNAKVCGEARILDCAEVNRQMKISSGSFVKNTFEESIRCQTGLLPFNGKVIAYKQVNKDLTSLFDRNFQYMVGEWAEAKEPDMSDSGCASGLHFSNPNYWNGNADIKNTTILIAEIDLKDIITVQQGKIRCKRAFILGTYNV